MLILVALASLAGCAGAAEIHGTVLDPNGVTPDAPGVNAFVGLSCSFQKAVFRVYLFEV